MFISSLLSTGCDNTSSISFEAPTETQDDAQIIQNAYRGWKIQFVCVCVCFESNFHVEQEPATTIIL